MLVIIPENVCGYKVCEVWVLIWRISKARVAVARATRGLK